MDILDTHHHLWQYNPVDYSWMDGRMEILRRNYLPDQLSALMPHSHVTGSIAVQARQMIEETRWLLELAERYPFIRGVVGWVDLCSPIVHQQLDEFYDHPKLVGVRHVVHDEPDDRFMYREDFRSGIRLLRDYNLNYDLLIFPRHLEAAIDLVESFPGQRFVINHLAKPAIRDRQLDPWRGLIRKLATFPDVFCKLSGMVTEASWMDWKPQDLYPYLDILFDCFGPDRLMTGSDWPVCLLAGSYARVMNILPDYMYNRGISPEDQVKVLFQTGKVFYLSGEQ